MNKISQIIKNNKIAEDFFHGIPEHHYDKLYVKTFKEKDLIVNKEDEVNFCYLVISGEMNVYNEFINGKNYIVEKIQSGLVIGEMEITGSEENYISTVMALTKCTAIYFPVELYEYMLYNYSEFSFKAAIRLGKMLCHISKVNGDNVVYSSKQSMALLLQKLYEEASGKSEIRIIRDTRQELSEKTGMSLRTVNRAISYFNGLGIISLNKGKIQMTKDNYDNLMNFINENF